MVTSTDVHYVIVFFFQAEDGIRDHCVTGVQTCALPILVGEEVKRSRRQNPSAEAMGHAPRSFSCRRLRHSLPGTNPSHVGGIRENDVETPFSNEAQAFPEPAWTLARDADRTLRAELCPSRNRLVRHWRFQPVEIELGKCPRPLERR